MIDLVFFVVINSEDKTAFSLGHKQAEMKQFFQRDHYARTELFFHVDLLKVPLMAISKFPKFHFLLLRKTSKV